MTKMLWSFSARGFTWCPIKLVAAAAFGFLGQKYLQQDLSGLLVQKTGLYNEIYKVRRSYLPCRISMTRIRQFLNIPYQINVMTNIMTTIVANPESMIIEITRSKVLLLEDTWFKISGARERTLCNFFTAVTNRTLTCTGVDCFCNENKCATEKNRLRILV